MHIPGRNACAEMAHQHGSCRQPFYDRRNPSMENATSLRGSVGDLQFWEVILHKKVQEDPSTPLQKPREEVKDPGREVGPTRKIIIKLKTQK
jgi:hypothetical protein